MNINSTSLGDFIESDSKLLFCPNCIRSYTTSDEVSFQQKNVRKMLGERCWWGKCTLWRVSHRWRHNPLMDGLQCPSIHPISGRCLLPPEMD